MSSWQRRSIIREERSRKQAARGRTCRVDATAVVQRAWSAFRGKLVAGGKHWAVYAADRPDGAYLLLDVSGVAALLGAADRRLLGGPVEVLRFESPEARDAYVRSRGWS